MLAPDPVAAPTHYTQQIPGVECIDFTQHMPFCRGSAMKYLWRAGSKGSTEDEYRDLLKARRFLDVELQRLALDTYTHPVPRTATADLTDLDSASYPVERWHE